MISTFRHIIVWSLIGTLLFGQTGFSLHQIYCFCKGEWEASIFTEDNSVCEEHEEDVEYALPACCNGNAKCTAYQPDSESEPLPCTNDQVVYRQLDQPAVPTTPDNWNVSIEWPSQYPISNFAYFLPSNKCADILTTPFVPPDPKVKDGRSIRTWVQSYLC